MRRDRFWLRVWQMGAGSLIALRCRSDSRWLDRRRASCQGEDLRRQPQLDDQNVLGMWRTGHSEPMPPRSIVLQAGITTGRPVRPRRGVDRAVRQHEPSSRKPGRRGYERTTRTLPRHEPEGRAASNTRYSPPPARKPPIGGVPAKHHRPPAVGMRVPTAKPWRSGPSLRVARYTARQLREPGGPKSFQSLERVAGRLPRLAKSPIVPVLGGPVG